MVFILGIMALFQALVLPGFLIRSVIKRFSNDHFLYYFIVAASLLINNFLVLIMIALRIYTQSVMLLIILIESIGILILNKKQLLTPIITLQEELIRKITLPVKELLSINNYKNIEKKWVLLHHISLLIFIAGSGVLLFSLYTWVRSFGSVFSAWDAVVSYNQWALVWAKGEIPRGITEYPQMMPINWSLTYLLTNSQIQFFAKFMHGVFPVILIASFYIYAISKKSFASLLLIPALLFSLFVFSGQEIYDGYMDIALTTFTFLTFLAFLRNYEDSRYTLTSVYISGAFALAAALTKQQGIIVVFSWAAINGFLAYQEKVISVNEIIKPINLFIGIMVLWYGSNAFRIYFTGDSSSFLLTNTWAWQDLQNIWNVTVDRISYLGWYVLYIPLALFSAIFSSRGKRIVFFFFILPYLGITFLYGKAEHVMRYQMMLLPSMFLQFGSFIDEVMNKINGLITKFNLDQSSCRAINNLRMLLSKILAFIGRLPKVTLLFLLISTVLISSIKWPDQKLNSNFLYRQQRIGNKNLNATLYNFLNDKDPKWLVLSWYYMNFLPGLENRALLYTDEKYEIDPSSFYSELNNNPNIKYFLIPESIKGELKAFFENKIKTGKYNIIGQGEGWEQHIMLEISEEP